jgi:hypothetical protein
MEKVTRFKHPRKMRLRFEFELGKILACVPYELNTKIPSPTQISWTMLEEGSGYDLDHEISTPDEAPMKSA